MTLHLLPPAPTPRTAATGRPQGNVTPLFVLLLPVMGKSA